MRTATIAEVLFFWVAMVPCCDGNTSHTFNSTYPRPWYGKVNLLFPCKLGSWLQNYLLTCDWIDMIVLLTGYSYACPV